MHAVIALQAARLARCRQGASAVEFALFAPMLCFGLLAMVDIGLAVAVRMELDRNVRAGAQAAISLEDPEPAIAAVVRTAANDPELAVQVDLTCRCDSDAISCSLFCPSGEEPSAFYDIQAERLYSGPFFEERMIASVIRVQVR